MIESKVFQNISRKTGIKAEALEKDYVMNLIIDAMAHCPKTRDSFFFKGGCCVHKCFSEHTFQPKEKGLDDYFLRGRFSSDIDLTVKPEAMSEEKLNEAFTELQSYLLGRHGLRMNQFSFSIYENNKLQINGHNKQSCRGMVHFEGPMYNNRFNSPALKFDITADERVVFPPYKRLIYNPYSKEGQELVLVAMTYTLRDIFAEKVRALFERCSPRDIFDLKTLMTHPDLDKRRKIGIGLGIIEKFDLKHMSADCIGMDYLTRSQDGQPSLFEKCRSSWQSLLERQVIEVPPFEAYWKEAPEIIHFASTCVADATAELNTYQQKHTVDKTTAIQLLLRDQNNQSVPFQRVIDRITALRKHQREHSL